MKLETLSRRWNDAVLPLLSQATAAALSACSMSLWAGGVDVEDNITRAENPLNSTTDAGPAIAGAAIIRSGSIMRFILNSFVVNNG